MPSTKEAEEAFETAIAALADMRAGKEAWPKFTSAIRAIDRALANANHSDPLIAYLLGLTPDIPARHRGTPLADTSHENMAELAILYYKRLVMEAVRRG